MTELGNAYVQILPSAKGIKGKIAAAIGPDAEAAGKESGSKLGGGLVSAIKGAVAAVGIGTLIKNTLEAGGNLQQSFGGLDTLYGDAADAAKNYAMEAAKAGISANTYAEQATSMGAALKAAFGGDTAAAAESANMAIMDMADNAAKMGTDIGSLQNAYAGFAKGNYTMLDNLKLGYGGTASEMKRLLADATKLTGVKYDINNLGDVYAAIHAIQEDLGLTGVAAAEAETTLSGSFNAMKASAENLMAGLALGEDIGPQMEQLVGSVGTFLFDNLLPMVGNTAVQIPGVLVSGFGAISDRLPDLMAGGMSMMDAVIEGIRENLPGALAEAANMTVGMIGTIGEYLPDFLTKGIELIGQIIAGLVEAFPGVVDAVLGFDWLGLGSSIIDGIVQGLVNAGGAIGRALLDIAGAAWDGFLGFFEIHSPSHKAEKATTQIPKGMAIGIDESAGEVYRAMDQLNENVYSRFPSAPADSSGTDLGPIAGQINELKNAILGMQVVLDSGETVGGLAPQMNNQLGAMATAGARG